MANDFSSSITLFNHISTRLFAGTLTTAAFVLFNTQFAWEVFTHNAELFRHNWFAEQEKVEENMKILKENMHKDSSANLKNIHDPNDEGNKESQAKTEENKNETTNKAGKPKINVDLLPRDKFAGFSYLVRIHKIFYILLAMSLMLTWLLLAFLITSQILDYTKKQLFTNTSFAYVQTKELFKAHRHLTVSNVHYNKCYGTIREIGRSLTDACLIAIRVFVGEKSIASTTIDFLIAIFQLAILLDSAVYGIYQTIVHYPTKNPENESYIYFYGSCINFLQLFFVFTLFYGGLLVYEFEMRQDY